MATLQTVVDRARKPLNDGAAADADRRYPDATLLDYAVHGLLRWYRLRRDLFIGSSAPSLSLGLASTFPLSDEYIEPLADYVTARAEMVDDENVIDERAALFMKISAGEV